MKNSLQMVSYILHQAQEQGIARLTKERETLYAEAAQTIRDAREAVQLLMREGLIRTAPDD